jgi:signal transduction histidine kinase
MSFTAQMREAASADVWHPHGAVACRSGAETIIGALEQRVPAPGSDADLRRRYRTLQRAYEGRGMAMAVAGHDLRQPLQVIGMVLARLADRAGDARDLSWLDIANGEIARLSAGLDHLAVLSREDDCATGGPVIGDLCVDAVLAETAAAWRHHASAKGLRLKVIRSGLVVRSNARLLGVVVGNLVSNAIKYTDHGGVVIGCRRRGGRAVIEVVDTGRGFAETSDVVFSPYWRADHDEKGLGLGLSIVRRTADLLGHDVGIRSRPGLGSRVSLTAARGVTAS